MGGDFNINEDGNLRRKPLSTLKSNACITLFKSLDGFNEIRSSDLLQSNWLALEPQYFPVMTFGSTSYKDMSAKYFTKATFIQDALDNWGTLGMDSALFELFQAKYPEIAIKVSTYLVQASKDYAYQMKKLKFTENSILLDKQHLEKEIDLTLVFPFSKDSVFSPRLRKAMMEKQVYGMSPYMAYSVKKKLMGLWQLAFDPNHTAVYNTLNPYEKITFDYLQHLRFEDVLVDSDFDFQKAHKTYQDSVGERSIAKELHDLYKEDVGNHRKELTFFQGLVERQFVSGQEKKLLQTPDDIGVLLSKFSNKEPRSNRFQTRRGRVERMRGTLVPNNQAIQTRIRSLRQRNLNQKKEILDRLFDAEDTEKTAE
jgi:hypothetical protein